MNEVGIYIGCICALLLICIFLTKKLYDFSIVILNVEESLEASLDILDEKYKSMNKILETPVFFDSIEVRQVLSDIRDCHNAVLVVANKLTNNIGLTGDIKETSKESK